MLLHERAGLVHRDIKPANILADFVPSGAISWS
jgi:serine/threonine protein kinase